MNVAVPVRGQQRSLPPHPSSRYPWSGVWNTFTRSRGTRRRMASGVWVVGGRGAAAVVNVKRSRRRWPGYPGPRSSSLVLPAYAGNTVAVVTAPVPGAAPPPSRSPVPGDLCCRRHRSLTWCGASLARADRGTGAPAPSPVSRELVAPCQVSGGSSSLQPRLGARPYSTLTMFQALRSTAPGPGPSGLSPSPV